MPGFDRSVRRLFLALLVAATLISCSRSDQVGWSGREMPDSAEGDSLPELLEGDYWEKEYTRLSAELSPLLQAAMADEEMQAQYQRLVARVDESVAEKSPFYRGLIDRKEEIEARFAEVEEEGKVMTERERGELRTHYRNILYELGRIREFELQAGDFKDPYWEFKLRLFDRMRELAPERAPDIDRLRDLEQNRPADAELPEHLRPPPNQ